MASSAVNFWDPGVTSEDLSELLASFGQTAVAGREILNVDIQAGTIYVNRAAGATTGAWPGVQAFGGRKGSGSSGKGIGGLYTLALYMQEQSRTIIG